MKKRNKNKRISAVFFTIGFICLFAALGFSVYNNIVDKNGGEASERILAELVAEREMYEIDADTDFPSPPVDPNAEMPTVIIGGVRYIGTIRAPKIGLELPVAAEWDINILRYSPCRYWGSAYKGNFVICGHNYVTHFGPISDLGYGDEVTFTDVEGNEFRYKVSEIEIIYQTGVEEMVKSEHDLTLFTCTLGGNERITVRCDKITEGATDADEKA